MVLEQLIHILEKRSLHLASLKKTVTLKGQIAENELIIKTVRFASKETGKASTLLLGIVKQLEDRHLKLSSSLSKRFSQLSEDQKTYTMGSLLEIEASIALFKETQETLLSEESPEFDLDRPEVEMENMPDKLKVVVGEFLSEEY